jgi:hypothetical protein
MAEQKNSEQPTLKRILDDRLFIIIEFELEKQRNQTSFTSRHNLLENNQRFLKLFRNRNDVSMLGKNEL